MHASTAPSCLWPSSLLAEIAIRPPCRTRPNPQDTTNTTTDTTTRFIGYMTNKSIAFPAIAVSDRPLTSGEKFKLFLNQSVSPPYLLAAGIAAGFDQAQTLPRVTGRAGAPMAAAMA